MISPASYEVIIREILEKSVFVAANSLEEAQRIVEFEYYDQGNIILTDDNYIETEITAMCPSDEEPDL